MTPETVNPETVIPETVNPETVRLGTVSPEVPDAAGRRHGHVDDGALAVAAETWLSIGLSSEPTDRAAAEAGVRRAYALAGLSEPERFVWHGSPYAGALAAARLVADGQAGRSVRGQVRTRPWAAARGALTNALGAAGWSRHWAASGARTWQLVTDRLVTPLRTRIEAEAPADQPGARLALLDAVHGQHDAAWLPAFEGVPELSGVADVARAAGWWWPYERVVVLTERPSALHRDNLGRLHHGDGPALSYPDGWAMYAWRGMPIPAEVASQLATLTVKQIQAEENAEVRRVMLEHFGFDRYLRECEATRVHSDETGVLWRVAVTNDEPLVMVEVVNSTPEPDGSVRTYFLRVPPDTRTARGGVAWTFNMTEAEYAPLAQT